MYPLTKEEIHFLKNMRDFGTTRPIILATGNGCRMPGFDTYAEALEVKKLSFQDSTLPDEGASQANPKSSISLSHLSLIRPKKKLHSSDHKYSSAASTQLQSIPKYEDAMIAKYVSGQFKKGKEAYMADFGGSKGMKHHRNNSMINLTHKGYKNHDFAVANKNRGEISNFQIPKLASLEEDRNEATNMDVTRLISPIAKDPSVSDTDKLNIDLEMDLSRSHRKNQGLQLNEAGMTQSRAFLVNKRPSLARNHRKTKSSLPEFNQ